MNAVRRATGQHPGQRRIERMGVILRNGDGPNNDLHVIVGQGWRTGDCQPPEITLGRAGHAQFGVHEGVPGHLEARLGVRCHCCVISGGSVRS